MLPITQKLITNSSNRPFRNLQSIKGIIVHWTANSGTNANALAHYNFFQNHDVGASAHFFVDSNQIVQIIPDTEEAYHVGLRNSSGYTDLANTIRGNHYTPNAFLIGVEMCVNPESDWDTTLKNTIELVNHLMTKHRLNSTQVWRHYDITLKDCPKMMTYKEDEGWRRFLDILNSGVFPNESTKIARGTVQSPTLNVRIGNGSYFKKVGSLNQNDSVDIYESIGEWYRIGKGQWVSKMYVTAQPVSHTVPSSPDAITGIVTVTSLNARSGPSTLFPVVSRLLKGTSVTIYTQQGDWFHIGDNLWIHKSFVDVVVNTPAYKNGFITANTLNIRKGAGTNQPVVGQLKKDDEVKIFEERNNWYRIGVDQWVYALYVIQKSIRQGRVDTDILNVRKGPGTQFAVVRQLHRSDKVAIDATESDWHKIGTDEWVSANYIFIEEL